MPKHFKLSGDDIKPIATGFGACYASDEITVRGCRVGFMYREAPDNDQDSGWRFLSGTESQDFLDNPDNVDIFDVNTIARVMLRAKTSGSGRKPTRRCRPEAAI